MHVDEQGVHSDARPRYRTVPRSLVFVTSVNPASGALEILLLKGAPHKRLWAGKYNGIGGHVEGNEDVLSSAEREVREEAGLTVQGLWLRGVVNVYTGTPMGSDAAREPPAGVMVFVFRAEAGQRRVKAGREGTPEWIPVARLADYPLVDDLYALIPRALADGPFFYGHYTPRPDGTMEYSFRG